MTGGVVVRSAGLLLLALAALWLVVRLVTGFDGLVGQDPYAYAAHTAAVKEAILGGPRPGPFFWPVGYPLVGAALALVGAPAAVVLQLVSAAAWLAAVIAGVALLSPAGEPARRGDAAYWVVAFALAPYVLRSSLMVMSDALAVTGVLWCLVCAVRWLEGGSPRWLVAAGGLAGAAVAVRWAAAPVLAPMLLVLGVQAARRRRLVALAGAALAGAACFLPQTVLAGPAGLRPDHPFLAGWSPLNAVRLELTSSEGVQRVAIPSLVAVTAAPVHPGYFVFGLLALPWLRRRDLGGVAPRLALAGFAAGAAFLAGLPIASPRFALLVEPLALIALAPAWRRLLDAAARRARWAPAVLLTAVAVAQLGLAGRALVGPLALDRLEREVASYLADLSPTTLHTFSFTPALEALNTGHRLVELWSVDPEPPRPGDLVLFAPDRLRGQWADHRLFANWKRIESGVLLESIRSFDGGWTLWRVVGERPEHGLERVSP